MRYPKNSIQLSGSRDLPLLRQILRSEFVTRSQLFAFSQLNHSETGRHSFDWRIRRLVTRGLVLQQTLAAGTGETVYSVTSSAANLLQGMGEYCLIGPGRTSANAARNALHAIGLNEIHLSALYMGMLVRWVGSMEIRSQNELTGFGFAKDYDAVVTLRTDRGERRFALEYERTPKQAKCYREIAGRIAREMHLDRLLYLVANYDILRFISAFFADAEFPVFFGLLTDWHSRLLEMPVWGAGTKRISTLRSALDRRAAEDEAKPPTTNLSLPFH